MQLFFLMMRRECLLFYRNAAELLNPLFFFIIITSLFPLATTPNLQLLRIIGPGVVWVAALLATLLSLSKLFYTDREDGSLERFILLPHSLSLVVFAKVFAHWVMFALPLILISPLLAMMFHLNGKAMGVLMLSLLLGTPVLSLLGAIGAALTVGLRNSGLLLALIILPLYVPVLIFGAGAVVAADTGMPYFAQMDFLAALLVLSLTLAPFATAAALRVGVSYDA